MALDQASVFVEQVSLSQLTQSLVYTHDTVGAILVVVGLIMNDVGGIRRRNSFNATVEKMVGFFISFTTYYFIGFAF